MRKPLIVITICWCVFWVSGASATDFMTDRVVMKMTAHLVPLYCRSDMWRIEHNTYGPVDVTIVRKDKGVMWLLMARTKRFMTCVDSDIGPTCQDDLVSEQRRDLIGTETLQGCPTTVSEVTVREGSEEVTYYEWRADDVQITLRLARKYGTWGGRLYQPPRDPLVNPTFFELPSHYHPVELRNPKLNEL